MLMQLRKIIELNGQCEPLHIRYQIVVFGKVLFSVVTKRFKTNLKSI